MEEITNALGIFKQACDGNFFFKKTAMATIWRWETQKLGGDWGVYGL